MAEYCRRSKREMLADLDDQPVSSRMVGHSTMEYVRADGVRVIRYQATDIVLIKSNGAMQLFAGGWLTINTRKRINDYLPEGMSLYADGGWWLCRGNPWDAGLKRTKRTPFTEGMRIGPRGGVRSAPRPKRRRAIKLSRKDAYWRLSK